MIHANASGRLDHVLYPNGQRTDYAYWPNLAANAGNGDQRLRQIQNLRPDGSHLSTFGYTYDAEGLIQGWARRFEAGNELVSAFQYDFADQLIGATVPSASAAAGFIYRYDRAGNRTSEQIDQAVTAATPNNLNQLTSLSATGPIRFEGALDEAGTPSHL